MGLEVPVISPELEDELVGEVMDLLPEEATLVPAVTRAASTSTARMREIHHATARMLASGMKQSEVAQRVGLADATISLLVNHNAAFKDLISDYRERADFHALDLREEIRATAFTALNRLHDVLADDSISPEFLRKATADLLDRTGHSPIHRSESRSLGIVLTGEDLAEVKSLAVARAAGSACRVIEASAEVELAPAPSEDSGADASSPVHGRPAPDSETDRPESLGEDL